MSKIKMFSSSSTAVPKGSSSTKLGATLVSGVCVSINIMMGSGYLALPAVFQKAGPAFSIFSLVFVGIVMYVTCCWEGRAVCRASFRMASSKVREVSEALRLFVGEGAALSYVLVLSVSFLGVVWAYAILFAESLSSSLPLLAPEVACSGGSEALAVSVCYMRYLLNLAIFGVATTPLALIDVSDQACFQVCITALTALLVALMTGTAAHAFTLDQMAYCFPNVYLVPGTAAAVVPASVLKDFLSCLSACVFSIYLNGSVVMVTDALGDKTGGRPERMYGLAIAACCGTYAVLYFLVVCFGPHVDPLVNLNWPGFRFPVDASTAAAVVALGAEGTEQFPGSLLSRCVELYVVLFPALVVLSVYPLSTKIVANLLLEVIFGVEDAGASPDLDPDLGSGLDHADPEASFPSDSKSIALLGGGGTGLVPSYQGGASPLVAKPAASIYHTPAAVKTGIRVVVNLAPIVGAALQPDVETIVVFVGGVSVVVGLVYPALLSAASATAIDDPEAKPVPVFLSPTVDWKEHPVLRLACFAAGCVLTVLILASPWL